MFNLCLFGFLQVVTYPHGKYDQFDMKEFGNLFLLLLHATLKLVLRVISHFTEFNLLGNMDRDRQTDRQTDTDRQQTDGH